MLFSVGAFISMIVVTLLYWRELEGKIIAACWAAFIVGGVAVAGLFQSRFLVNVCWVSVAAFYYYKARIHYD